jgi:hypothetical protein
MSRDLDASTLEPLISNFSNVTTRGTTKPARCPEVPVSGRALVTITESPSRMSAQVPNQLDDELSPLLVRKLMVARLGEAEDGARRGSNAATVFGAFGMSIT